DEGQTHARPAAELAPSMQAAEHLEHAIVVRRVDADPVVADADLYEGGGLRTGGWFHSDLDPLVRLVVVLHAIPDEVVEYFSDQIGSAKDGRQPLLDNEFHTLFFQHQLENADDTL